MTSRLWVRNNNHTSSELPSHEEYARILDYLDPNDRDVWYMVFMISGHCYGYDLEIFSIAQQWARRSSNRHERIDARKERYEFTQSAKNCRVGIGCLIAMAKRRGYVPPAKRNSKR